MILVDHLSKEYIIKHKNNVAYETFRDTLANHISRLFTRKKLPQKESFLALDDLSFEIKTGERVGIIGRNGAGKSTLLKLLSRIIEPTKGRIVLEGRVASLLEVGTGFHPELTGRENIYLNASIMGMSRKETQLKFDEIVAFSEIEYFLDTPIKQYSSGMAVRLAFAVAAHLDSEILIIDEVLAVGDMKFQKKCFNKIAEIKNCHKTILLVSHQMGAISTITERVLILDKGKIISDSLPKEAIQKYLELNATVSGVYETNVDNNTDCTIKKIALVNRSGNQTVNFDIKEDIFIQIECDVLRKFEDMQIALTISKDGIDVFHAFNNDGLEQIPTMNPGKYCLRCEVPGFFLKAGHYYLSVNYGQPQKLFSNLVNILDFYIHESSISTNFYSYHSARPGLIVSPCRWEREVLNEFV